MSNPQIPNSLQQLAQLAQVLQQHASVLSAYRADFGSEHIGYVIDTSASILGKLQNMMQSCLAAVPPGGVARNPMVCKDARHDMRNLIAVVKGFSELMQMDGGPSHPADQNLQSLRTLSDQFVQILDQVKAVADADPTATPAAAAG